MNEQEKSGNKASNLTHRLYDAEQPIAAYLRTHPEFFTRHLDLLETLRIPHPCGSAVSLLERQLLLIRESNTQLQKKLTELVEVAQENGYLISRMERLTLMLIKHRELNSMLQGIKTILKDEFNADYVTIKLTAQAATSTEETFLSASHQALFESVLRSDRPQCGQFDHEQVISLFGEADAFIGSVALIPLRGTGWCGLLGVGSQDKQRFHAGMGMLFLKSMGELISQALQTNFSSIVVSNDDSAAPSAVSKENE
jgi:uncharacterized protein YigA (DUF484 family)